MGSTTTLSGSWQSPSVRHLPKLSLDHSLLVISQPAPIFIRHASRHNPRSELDFGGEGKDRDIVGQRSLVPQRVLHHLCNPDVSAVRSVRGELRTCVLFTSYFRILTCVPLTSYFLLLTCVLLPPHRCSSRSPQLGSCLHSPALSPESDLFSCFQAILKFLLL